MLPKISRRGVLATTGGSLLALSLSGPATATAASQVNPAGLTLLTSTDGVNVPPKGSGVMKFSYSWPEPSVDFAGLQFAFDITTFENTYAVDPALVTLTRQADSLTLQANGFTWAGGQQKAAGSLTATIRQLPDSSIEWSVAVQFDKPVKCVKTIVRGVPQGRLSVSGEAWQDTKDAEKIFEYPALMGGMATPLVAVEGKDAVWAISAKQTEVRPTRFFFWPGPDNYKVELIYEQAAWDKRGDVQTHVWRIGKGADFVAAAKPHFEHLEQAWKLPKFQERSDAPEWMKHISVVLSLHGQHWSGYIMNDYARQLEILKWAAKKVDPKTVMVFLAGWDRRYYWDYPTFNVDDRMGGEAGFHKLITEGQKLGYHFLVMFGTNIANPTWPGYDQIADAVVRDPYGVRFPSNYVDWDGDRKGDPSMVFMNVAVDSWRNHLTGRISSIIETYGIDGYFLDICGLWENNPDGDMFVGTQKLVSGLAAKHPGIPSCAEMQYDAQMGIIPMSHVPRYALYAQANYDHVASFSHLSYPAPGRGSTGVHEWGFSQYKPITLGQAHIPTITFVDDTFEKHKDLVTADLITSQKRFLNRGGKT